MALEESLALEESTHRHGKMKQLLQRSDVPPPEKSNHFCGNVESLLRRSRDTFAEEKFRPLQKSLFILLGGQI